MEIKTDKGHLKNFQLTKTYFVFEENNLQLLNILKYFSTD